MKKHFVDIVFGHGPGLRIIKTGVAVTLCVAVCSILNLDKPFLAMIAAVLSMGKSIDYSVRAGRNKLAGALLGAALGCGLAAVLPANAGLCGIGVIVLLYLCHLLRLSGAGALSCCTLTAVMFCAVPSKPWVCALSCAEAAAVGIVISVAVNLLIFPPNYAEDVERDYARLREKAELADADVSAMREADTEELAGLLKKLSGGVRLYVSETRLLRGEDDEIFGISRRVSTYLMILDELKALNGLLEGKNSLPEELLPVYDYHMKRLHILRDHAEEGEKKPKEK